MELDISTTEVISILNSASRRMSEGLYSEQAPRYSDCFVYILHGCAKYTFSGKQVDVRAGDLLYLPYSSIYSILVGKDYDVVWVDCMLSDRNGIRKDREPFALRFGTYGEADFLTLAGLWLPDHDYAQLRGKALVYSVLARILQSETFDYFSAENRRKLTAAEKKIRENLCENELNIDKMAEFAGMSSTHFRRLFRKMFGMSPGKYLQALRMKEAARLLLESSATIESIALSVGFSDGNYFSRAFSSLYGMAPSSYRRVIIKKND